VLGFTYTFWLIFFNLISVPCFINPRAALNADQHLGCARVGEVRDRNQAENRPKCASKS